MVSCLPPAPLVVLDGAPLKGLWYNWVYAADGWPSVQALAPLYRAAVAAGALGVPDLYLVLGATEAQLRARHDGDGTRTRRNVERHLQQVEPQRRYKGQGRRGADARRVARAPAPRREVGGYGAAQGVLDASSQAPA